MMDDDHSTTDLTEALIQRAVLGDEDAARALFSQHAERLRRMVHLRLDRRIQGRVDEDDVLQEAFLDVSRRLAEYQADPQLPFFSAHFSRHALASGFAQRGTLRIRATPVG